MYELTISGNFASAHSLRGYDGPCESVHGHTWKVEVTVHSGQLNELGLVMDFKELKTKLKELTDRMDHVNLNDLPDFAEQNPSTENIARFIFHEFAKLCHPLAVERTRVWESDGASVTFYE